MIISGAYNSTHHWSRFFKTCPVVLVDGVSYDHVSYADDIAGYLVVEEHHDDGRMKVTADGRHWHELRRDGYATRERTGHKLTPLGRGAAQTIMRDLAVKFDVHHFTRSGGRGTGRGTSTLCSCRKFGRGPFTNTDIGEQHLRRAEDAHLRDVANGFPKTRAMVDFLNEVDPPRFNFNSGDAPQVSSPMMNAGGPDDPGTDARCVRAGAFF